MEQSIPRREPIRPANSGQSGPEQNQPTNKTGQVGESRNKGFVYVISALAAICGLLFGVDTGVISGALLFIKQDFGLNSFMQEVVTSAVLVGAVIGSGVSGFFTDRLGRRPVIIVTAILFVIGSTSTALSPVVWWMVISRVVVGIAIGVASYIGPLYISEMAPPKMRGSLVSFNQLAVTIGILVAYLIDLAFSPAGLWRWMFAVHVIPALALGIGMFFVPDSPRYLIAKKKEDQARQVLQHIRGQQDVSAELDEIKKGVSEEKGHGWKELVKPAIRPALIVGIGLAIFQQVTGINTIIYYAPTIFQSAGINSNTSSILATVVVGVINVAFTIVAIWLLDKVGRRPLLLWGLVGMVLALAGLGITFLFPHLSYLAWLTLGFLGIYIASFAVGLGPVFWLLISEIYPTQVRGRASSLATLANWAANLVVALTFLTLINWLGSSLTFWLYGVIGIATWVFVFFLVPETKGRSLEEIQQKWEAGRGAARTGQDRDKDPQRGRNPGGGAGPLPHG